MKFDLKKCITENLVLFVPCFTLMLQQTNNMPVLPTYVFVWINQQRQPLTLAIPPVCLPMRWRIFSSLMLKNMTMCWNKWQMRWIPLKKYSRPIKKKGTRTNHTMEVFSITAHLPVWEWMKPANQMTLHWLSMDTVWFVLLLYLSTLHSYPVA